MFHQIGLSMTSKHRKICSTLAIREIQMKSIMAYYFHIHKNTETERIPNANKDVKKMDE